jgi:hypothetical protein
MLRQLNIGGEQADDVEDKPKGTSTYLLYLEGVRRATRNKTDIPQREKDTHFVFRAMDPEKWEYSIGTDLVLQPEAYRRMVCEQGDTQTDHHHPAFTACGLISRVQSLALFSNKEKLKLVLVGSVLIEGSAEPSLSLEDFVMKEPITNRAAPCASHNSGMVAALKNLAMVLHILFRTFTRIPSLFLSAIWKEQKGSWKWSQPIFSVTLWSWCNENSFASFVPQSKNVKSRIAPSTGVVSGSSIIALFGTAAAGTESTRAISMYSPASSLAPGTTNEAFSTALSFAPSAMS